MWYAALGAEDIFKRGCADLPEQLTLICDGVEVPIPKDSQGIIFLNIDSYAGGIPIWSSGTIEGDELVSSSDEEDEEEREKKGGRKKESRRTSVDENGGRKGSNATRYRTDSVDVDGGLDGEGCHSESLSDILARCNLPSSCQDGMLDIVSIRGCLHLGQINVGLSSATLVGQCREAEVHTRRTLPMQMDGEPLAQKPAVFKIKR